MAGDWDADDLGRGAAAVRRAARRRSSRAWMQTPAPLLRAPARRRTHENTVAGARRNIQRHYDLSNELFALFLDESMTYSSRAVRAAATRSSVRRLRKIDRLLDAVGVGPGTRVLEIGTGWGALAIRAAQRGATRHDAHAVARAAAAGAASGVDAPAWPTGSTSSSATTATRDGTYDAVVSVEMIEAVGERYWPTYFADPRAAARARRPVGIQAIVLEHDRMVATRDQYTWIHKYIFPGGALPSVRAIEETLRRAHRPPHRPSGFASRRRLRAHAAALARALRRPRRRSRGARVRRARSAACGTSTSRTARPGSPPATSTSCNWCSRRHDGRAGSWMTSDFATHEFLTGLAATAVTVLVVFGAHLARRTRGAPRQRDRRHLGTRFRRRRGRVVRVVRRPG